MVWTPNKGLVTTGDVIFSEIGDLCGVGLASAIIQVTHTRLANQPVFSFSIVDFGLNDDTTVFGGFVSHGLDS